MVPTPPYSSANAFSSPPAYPRGRAAELAAGAFQRVIRILLRLAGAGALAVIAGIAIGAVATAGGLVQLLVTLFAALALWIPAFMLLTGIHRWRSGRQQSAHRRQQEQLLSRTGGSSWKRLADVSGEHRPQLLALYRQLAVTHESLPSQTLDPEVHECRILIERRIPQLIESRLDSLPRDPHQSSRAVGELLDLIERFAADCREREERLLGARRADHEAVRRRIEAHIERGPAA